MSLQTFENLDEFGLPQDNQNNQEEEEEEDIFGGYQMTGANNKNKESENQVQQEEIKEQDKIKGKENDGDKDKKQEEEEEQDYDEDFDEIELEDDNDNDNNENIDGQLEDIDKQLQEIEEQEKQKQDDKDNQKLDQKDIEQKSNNISQEQIDTQQEQKKQSTVLNYQFNDENEDKKRNNMDNQDQQEQEQINDLQQDNIPSIEPTTTDNNKRRSKRKKQKELRDSVELQTQTGAEEEVVVVKRNYANRISQHTTTNNNNNNNNEETLGIGENINVENEMIVEKNNKQKISNNNSFNKESIIESQQTINQKEQQESQQEDEEPIINQEQRSENMELQDLLEDMQKSTNLQKENQNNNNMQQSHMKQSHKSPEKSTIQQQSEQQQEQQNVSFQERNILGLKKQQEAVQRKRKQQAEERERRENQFRIKSDIGKIEQKKQELKESYMHEKEDQQQEDFKVQNIRVLLRVRPLINFEVNGESVLEVDNDKIGENLTFIDRDQIKQNKFHKVFGPLCTQKEVFQEVKEGVQEVLNGYNFTIFAYGQTGSGKTYTMFGADWENVFQQNIQKNKQQYTLLENIDQDENFAGIIPRVMNELFIKLDEKHISSSSQQQSTQYNVYCSFFQIYNEKIYDLLQENSQELQIRQNKLDGLFIDGLAEFKMVHFLEVLQIIKKGERNRKIRETMMNNKSSRSHTVFQVLIEEEGQDKEIIKKSRINLVDLAGSEKINKQEVMSQEHMRELQNINQSLTVLGKVIHRLSHKTKMPIPYRESKLTRILQESLAGNTITMLMGNLSPSIYNLSETLSTLKFVERAQHIKLKVKQSQVNRKDNIVVHKLQKEIQYLRQLLQQKRQGNYTEVKLTEEIKLRLMRLEEENQVLRRENNENLQIQQIISENNRLKRQLYQYEVNSNQNIDRNNNHSSQSNRGNVHLPPIDKNQNSSSKSQQNSNINDSKVHNNQSQISNNNGRLEKSQIHINREKYRQNNNNSSIDSIQRLKHTNIKNYKENEFQIRIKGQSNAIKNNQIARQSMENKRNKEVKRILERIAYINKAQQQNEQHLNNELQRLEQDQQEYGNPKKSQQKSQQSHKQLGGFYKNTNLNRNPSQNTKNSNRYNTSNSQMSVQSSQYGTAKKKPISQMTPQEKHKMRMLKFQKDLANLESRFNM